MPEIQVRCPQCAQGVRAAVSDQLEVAQLTCRNCGKVLKVRVPRTQATTPAEDPLDFLSSPSSQPPPSSPPSSSGRRLPGYSGKGLPNAYPGGYGMRPQTKSAGGHVWMLAGGAAVVVLAMVGAGLWWLSGQDGGAGGGEASGWTAEAGGPAAEELQEQVTWPKLGRPESAEALGNELVTLVKQADQIAGALSDSELHTVGAERLAAAKTKFEDLLYRAWQAAPLDLTMAQTAENQRQQAAQIENMRSNLPTEPPKNYIWRLQGTNDPADHWGRACYEISQVKLEVEAALNARGRFLDPLKETSDAYDWSAEDRRVLSAYWLQGSLERDVVTELTACLREGVNIGRLTERCLAVLERHYEPARELAAVPSAQGTVLINEPKGTPYALQARSARRTLETLRERFAEEETIVWILSITKRFSDGIEDLQFGRGAIVSLVTGSTMREHYQEYVDTMAAREQERLAAADRERQELARQEQAARERKQQEEARVAAAEAAAKEAEQRRLADAERAREQAEAGPTELAGGSPQSADGGERTGGRLAGPGGGRPPRGFGPVGPRGPRSGFEPPAAPGPPAGFGQPRGGAGMGGGRPGQPGQFPSGPPAMGPSVTIRISGPVNMNVNGFLDKLKAALKTGNYQSSHSGGEATLTLGYGGDLQVVIDAIDFGKVQATDLEKREIRVVVPDGS